MNDTILTKADAEEIVDGLKKWITAKLETLYTEHNILHAAIMNADDNRADAAKWHHYKASKAVRDRKYKAKRRAAKLALSNAGGTRTPVATACAARVARGILVASANATTDATRAEGDSPTQPKAERVPPSEGGVK